MSVWQSKADSLQLSSIHCFLQATFFYFGILIAVTRFKMSIGDVVSCTHVHYWPYFSLHMDVMNVLPFCRWRELSSMTERVDTCLICWCIACQLPSVLYVFTVTHMHYQHTPSYLLWATLLWGWSPSWKTVVPQTKLIPSCIFELDKILWT